ncbi:MAG: PQQ-binding-like beta-propeller repeat protein [Pseudomonadota bacterium]
MNVLHYELSRKTSKVKANLPKATNLHTWKISDDNQFTNIPSNLKLSPKLQMLQKISPSDFNPSTNDSAIIIINDIIYTYTKSTLSAYNISLEKRLWSAIVPAKNEVKDNIGGSIAYDNGVVYVSSGTRDFVAYNAESGKEQWRYRAPNVIRYIPLIQNKQIYINSIDNTLFCINFSGKLLWSYDAPVYTLTSSHLYQPNIEYDNKLVSITTAGDLLVLNRYDGEEITQVNLAMSSIIGDGSLEKGPIVSPVMDKENLYVLTGESELMKINLAAYEISWRQNFPNAKSFWVSGNLIFLLNNNNQLIAVENENGKLVWMIDLPSTKKDEKYFGPIIGGGKIVLASNTGDFLLVSPSDGKIISHYKSGFSTNRMPLILNEKIYFIGSNGKIMIWGDK